MIRKIPALERYLAQHGWLSSYHLFSFADYYDPSNMNFGALRVFNDDTIDGESGFGAHSHQNMEIVTIMLEGELTHKDTIGNEEVMKSGEVQYMSAGSGVTHSEINASRERTHLYQIWIAPKMRQLSPTYAQKDFSDVKELNVLVPVVTDKGLPGAIPIQADATIYMAEFELGTSITYTGAPGRGVFIYLTVGVLVINDVIINAGDQVRITDEASIVINSMDDAIFVLIDVIL